MVDAADRDGVRKFVVDNAEIADGQHDSVRSSHERNLRDLYTGHAFVPAAEQDVFSLRLEQTAWQFQVFPAENLRHLTQRESVLAEPRFGDLNVDLVIARADQRRLSHARQHQQTVADPLGDFPQFKLRFRVG